MTGKVEQNIIALLYRQHPSPLTIRQVSEKLGKAYPHVHATATRLLKQGVLLKTVVGNAYACTLNLSNEKTKASLILEEYDNTERETHKKAVPQAAVEAARLLRSSPEALGCAWWDGQLIVLSRKPISAFRHILA